MACFARCAVLLCCVQADAARLVQQGLGKERRIELITNRCSGCCCCRWHDGKSAQSADNVLPHATQCAALAAVCSLHLLYCCVLALQQVACTTCICQGLSRYRVNFGVMQSNACYAAAAWLLPGTTL